MILEKYIRDIPDFPKPGILFKDIAPLLADPLAYTETVNQLEEQWADTNYDKIVGFDARGFLFGAPLAIQTNKPFVMARKAGKLPGETTTVSYGLEYGVDVLQMQADSINKGDKVLFIDDLLATGGTTKAGIDIVEKLGGKVVGCGYVMELSKLAGRDTLVGSIEDKYIRSLLTY